MKRNRERGAAAIEFTLVGILLVTILMSGLDFARLFAASISVARAARAGVAIWDSGRFKGWGFTSYREGRGRGRVGGAIAGLSCHGASEVFVCRWEGSKLRRRSVRVEAAVCGSDREIFNAYHGRVSVFAESDGAVFHGNHPVAVIYLRKSGTRKNVRKFASCALCAPPSSSLNAVRTTHARSSPSNCQSTYWKPCRVASGWNSSMR